MVIRVRARWWLFLALILAIALNGGAAAEPNDSAAAEASVQQVSLESLVRDALRRSPGLQAKKRAYEAARGRVIAAWLPDDPEVSVDVEGQPDVFRFSKRSDREYTVMQTIPFPTKLLLRAQIAAREAQMVYQRYKEEERSVAWHIEQPYYELYMTKKTRLALAEVRRLLEKLSNAVQARYEANQASQQDLLKARIELEKVDLALFDAAQREHLSEAHFSHLLNQSLETRYLLDEEQVSEPLALSRPELEQLAVALRPELRAVEIGIARAKAGRALAVTSWLPDLTGRIEARQFKGERGIREYDTFIGVTVPVWSLLKGVGGEWRSAGRDVQQAEALYAQMQNEVLLAVHEADAKVRSAENGLQAYKHAILPQAQQQVEVAFAAYEAGRTDFLNLIDAQRMLKDAQIAYYQIKAEHERGLSDLRLAVGGEMAPHRGPAR